MVPRSVCAGCCCFELATGAAAGIKRSQGAQALVALKGRHCVCVCTAGYFPQQQQGQQQNTGSSQHRCCLWAAQPKGHSPARRQGRLGGAPQLRSTSLPALAAGLDVLFLCVLVGKRIHGGASTRSVMTSARITAIGDTNPLHTPSFSSAFPSNIAAALTQHTHTHKPPSSFALTQLAAMGGLLSVLTSRMNTPCLIDRASGKQIREIVSGAPAHSS